MKTLKNCSLIALLVTAISLNTFAGGLGRGGNRAPFSSSIGGRIEINDGDLYTGPTFKHYFGSNVNYELMTLTNFDDGIEFYGLIQYSGSLPDCPPTLRYILGGGGNIGSWNGYNDPFVFGLTGIIGMEYTFEQIPLTLQGDWKPILNLYTEKNDRFWGIKFGVTARYVLK